MRSTSSGRSLCIKIAIAVSLTSGCAGSPTAPSPVAPSTPTAVPLTSITSGTLFDLQVVVPVATTMVIRDQAAWQSFWGMYTIGSSRLINGVVVTAPPPPAMTVDFSSNVVVVAAMGAQPTTGYSISLWYATKQAGVITVTVTRTTLGTCGGGDLVTEPIAISSMPATTESIVFNTVTIPVAGSVVPFCDVISACQTTSVFTPQNSPALSIGSTSIGR